MVDSPFNEDSKNIIFSRVVLNSREGRPENLWKMSNNMDIYCYANQEVVNLGREYQPQPPGTKIFVMPPLSYMPDQILRKKMKKHNFPAKL